MTEEDNEKKLLPRSKDGSIHVTDKVIDVVLQML